MTHSPTEHFTKSVHQNLPIDVSELHKIRRSIAAKILPVYNWEKLSQFQLCPPSVSLVQKRDQEFGVRFFGKSYDECCLP